MSNHTELSYLVAQTALTMSDQPVPTAAEILAAMTTVAEKWGKLEYARGVVAGSAHTSKVMNRLILKMSEPDERDQRYRQDMKDAGRGHLLP